MARQYGATDEVLDSLDDLGRCPLPESEKAALRFAERMTLEAHSVEAADIDRLRVHYDDDQIVELACVVGIFNYLNRFAEATGLWPTRPGEGGPEDPSEGASSRTGDPSSPGSDG